MHKSNKTFNNISLYFLIDSIYNFRKTALLFSLTVCDNDCFQVLRVFKKLHRTRLKTFDGDEYALQGNIFCTLLIIYYSRMINFAFLINNITFSIIIKLCCSLVVKDKINKEYRKYKNVTNQAAIEEVYLFVSTYQRDWSIWMRNWNIV